MRFLAFLFCWFTVAQPASAQTLAQFARNDLNLVIAMDCSWSVNSVEYLLQIRGIAAVFSDPVIINSIRKGNRGSIGVTLIQWSTHKNQHISIPWTRIATPQDAIRLANRVASTKRDTVEGGTSIAGALRKGTQLLDSAPFRADRLVIDVIADGENNNGERIEPVRDFVVGQGITVNALAVLNEYDWLHHYLRNRVIGGPGAFVEQAADYQDFVHAFRRKLMREIEGPLVTELQPRKRLAAQ